MSTAPVSAIIPCHNCERTISRAVESIAAQTIIPEEVILVDDCSSDNTLRILFELQEHYGAKWVTVIELVKNCGPGHARNVGWEKATKKYLAFLDADDAWCPHKVESQWLWMSQNPCFSLTGHAYNVISSNKVISNNKRPGSEGTRSAFNPELIRHLYLKNVFSTPTVMLKRSLPERFDPSKRYSEDYLLWLRIILSGEKCGWSSLPLTNLYKPAYGDSGLSANLKKMTLGEIENFIILYRDGLLPLALAFVLITWSLIKASRRLLTTVASRLLKKKTF